MKRIDEKLIEEIVHRALNDNYLPLCEGIEYNTYSNVVKFTDEHEDNVDTSLENNPVKDIKIVNGVPVWSIFKRKHSPRHELQDMDGNPLLYAMKNIDGWRFVSKQNRIAFEKRMEAVVDKFLDTYAAGITVVVPSGGGVNKLLANIIKEKEPDSVLIGDVMRKLSANEVWEDLSRLKSPFRKQFGRTQEQWNQTVREMTDAFKKMAIQRDGYFTYHLTPEKYRNAITTTLSKNELTCAKYVQEFYHRDILIIDDSISRGTTIMNACNVIKDFEPNSITVLTLFSKKYSSR